MQTLQSTLAGLATAVTLLIATSPVIAGHKFGGHHKHGSYGMAYGKPHHTYPRRAHPYCHRKPMAYGRHYGKWNHHGHHPMKRSHNEYSHPAYRYGYAGAMPNAYRSGDAVKPSSLGGGYATASGPNYGKATNTGTVSYGSGYTEPVGKTAKTAQKKDIVGMAAAAGDFSTLISAVNAAGLAETLANEGPFTVLAPRDAAFSELPKEKVTGLMSDTEALKGVLTYHVISGELSAADLLEKGEVTTLNGAKVSIAQLDVAKADVKASNGIIHVINSVLIPTE